MSAILTGAGINPGIGQNTNRADQPTREARNMAFVTPMPKHRQRRQSQEGVPSRFLSGLQLLWLTWPAIAVRDGGRQRTHKPIPPTQHLEAVDSSGHGIRPALFPFTMIRDEEPGARSPDEEAPTSPSLPDGRIETPL